MKQVQKDWMKNEMKFAITEEYIELVRLLKAVRLADSGGMAKALVEKGEVKRNGIAEYRKRAKIRAGEVIETAGVRIEVVKEND